LPAIDSLAAVIDSPPRWKLRTLTLRKGRPERHLSAELTLGDRQAAEGREQQRAQAQKPHHEAKKDVACAAGDSVAVIP